MYPLVDILYKLSFSFGFLESARFDLLGLMLIHLHDIDTMI